MNISIPHVDNLWGSKTLQKKYFLISISIQIFGHSSRFLGHFLVATLGKIKRLYILILPHQ